ncbi:hypothetical protein BRC97_00405 [Halobacteriales archaeon QS_6_71_20]|nr:MAG: hypothetical protein BRC97_00405 [Halobacteriales archaeon QS_6_71_20]
MEAASATTLAALDRLCADGRVNAGEHGVLLATGVGYDGDAGGADAETVERAALPAALGVKDG